MQISNVKHIHAATTARSTVIPNATLVAVATTHTTRNLLLHPLLPHNLDLPGLMALSVLLDLRDRMDQREYQDLQDCRVPQDFPELLAAPRDPLVCIVQIESC